MALDFNPTGKKVILSIDGGGMRGVIPAAMLAELEQMTGKPAYELFDMVVGTSTGAIIAAALAVGLSAERILNEIYRDKLPEAFRTQSGAGKWLRYVFGGLRSMYNFGPFLATLVPYVEGRKVRDISKPILLLTTKDVRTGTTYYIVNAGPGAPAFADAPLSGAVAASGAAPIYFPPVLGNLIDGGVGSYGNPCLAAATEALEYIGAAAGFSDGNVLLMSLGTGHTPINQGEGAAGRFWLLNWVQYVVIAGLYDAAIDQAFNTRAIYGRRLDFRRYNPLLERDSVSTMLGVDPGTLDPKNLTLDSARADEVELMVRIGRAYAQKIDWSRGDVMPWDTPGGQPKPAKLAVNFPTGVYR